MIKEPRTAKFGRVSSGHGCDDWRIRADHYNIEPPSGRVKEDDYRPGGDVEQTRYSGMTLLAE